MRKGRLGTFARSIAWGYLGALVGLLLLLRFVGEDWWWVTPLVYVPRPLLAGPLLITLPAVLYSGPRWMLLTQLAAVLLLLFPLLGLELHPLPPRMDAATPRIRVMSFNVYFGRGGCDAILDEVATQDPDVVVLQASSKRCNRALAQRFPALHVEAAAEFLMGTKLTVLDVYRPADLVTPLRVIAPAFMRYTLGTPIGPIDLFNIHPYSPRNAFQAARDVEDPRPFAGRVDITVNTAERAQQVAGIVDAARHATNPVILAGDTNLPGLSRLYSRYLASGKGEWKDGFASVGNGFGYTFPVGWKYHLRPWMRLDRILAGPQLRFLSFHVGTRASDHIPVIAEIAAAQ